MAHDVALDLGAQRAGRDGQGHVDHHVPSVDAHVPHHPEVHDGVAELGVDDRPQTVADLLGAITGWRAGDRRRGSVRLGGHEEGFYLRGGEFRPHGAWVTTGRRRR